MRRSGRAPTEGPRPPRAPPARRSRRGTRSGRRTTAGSAPSSRASGRPRPRRRSAAAAGSAARVRSGPAPTGRPPRGAAGCDGARTGAGTRRSRRSRSPRRRRPPRPRLPTPPGPMRMRPARRPDPTDRTSANASASPSAAPTAQGITASSAERPPTALGLAPRANRRFDSTRRAAITNAPAPATTTSATSIPAIRSSRAGPSIATSRPWTSRTTSSIALPHTGPFERLQKNVMKHRSSSARSSISSEMREVMRAASSASWSVRSRSTGACHAYAAWSSPIARAASAKRSFGTISACGGGAQLPQYRTRASFQGRQYPEAPPLYSDR